MLFREHVVRQLSDGVWSLNPFRRTVALEQELEWDNGQPGASDFQISGPRLVVFVFISNRRLVDVSTLRFHRLLK